MIFWVATEAVLDQLLVPINEPEYEPVLIWMELDTNPIGFCVMESHVEAAPLTYDAVSAYDADVARTEYDDEMD